MPAPASARTPRGSAGSINMLLVDKSGKLDLAQLRTLQDWFLKFELATVPGVSEVSSVGGFKKEYQVLIDPNRLRAFNIPLSRITSAVKAASSEVGGRVIEQSETELMIRSSGYIEKLEDLEQVVVFSKNGTPVLLKDVARVIIEGPELRRGVVELNGEGEVVSGIIVMRSGENALSVIKAVKEKIRILQAGLPEGVEFVTVYDRAPLIEGAVEYLSHKLIEEGLVVALICLIFLLHARSAFVAIITLPLGVLGAFMVMSAQGITANIMSLGRDRHRHWCHGGRLDCHGGKCPSKTFGISKRGHKRLKNRRQFCWPPRKSGRGCFFPC